MSKANAYYNGATGVGLYNNSAFQSNVTISGYGMFNYNGYYGGASQMGLEILSHGTITLANITANQNSGTGADIYTIGLNAPHAVTFSGTNTFEYNGNAGTESGLIVNADGNITVANLSAGHNYYRGADLDNFTNWDTNPFRTTATPLVPFTSFGSIFVNGFGNFVGNQIQDGLFGWTHGAITTTRVTASGNGDGAGNDRGINLTADGKITMTCTVAYGNNFRNLDLDALTITLKGLLSFGGIGSNTNLYSVTPVITACP